MMSTHFRFLSLLALLGISLRPAVAASLVKIWELNLGKWNNAAWGISEKFPVAALSFSPDGKRIALTATETKKEDGQLSGLLLVPKSEPLTGMSNRLGRPRKALSWIGHLRETRSWLAAA